MAETDGVTMERICPDPDCQHHNPPGSERCQICGKDIEFERDTPIMGAEPQQEGGGEQPDRAEPLENEAAGTDCPVCNSIGSVVNNYCPNCESSFAAGFVLKWDDERIGQTSVPPDVPLFIGRVPPVEVTLAQQIEANYQTVSRMHAELHIDKNGNLFIRDMGSQNGTKINSVRIAKFKPEQLRQGDVLSFSTTLSATVMPA